MNEVCLLNDSFPPEIDGVVNTVVNYAQELTARRIPVSVLTPENADADDSVFPFPVLRYPSLDLREKVGYTAGIPLSFKPFTGLEGRSIGLLHSHCPIASNTLARSLRESLEVPFIMTYHTKFDIDIQNVLRAKLLQAGSIQALINSISACDEVWTVSTGAGENLRKLGYEGDYTVMENGVDIPRARLGDGEIDALIGQFELPRSVPVFLFVGRLMWYKGIRIILDALAALRSQAIDFRMVFVGSGTEEEEIRGCVRTLGLDSRCLFPGPVYDRRELAAWYCRADLFLFPSTFDTSGLVVKEAAACSLPSVLVRGSCAAEGAVHAHNAFLIDENAASMAACLATVMHNREKLAAVGETASQELYLSWSDAISRAIDRYGVVTENFAAGKYPRHRRPSDRIFQLEAELDEALMAAKARRQKRKAIFDRYL